MGPIIECYVHIVEKREVGSGEKVLQVLASTSESKGGKSRKDRTCEWRRMLARWMPDKYSGLEFEGEFFELGQRRQTSDNFLG